MGVRTSMLVLNKIKYRGTKDMGYGNDRGGFGGGGFRKPPVNVGDEVDVTIEAVGAKGDGVAKKDGFVLFIPGVREGQNVRVRVTRVLRKVGFAEVIGEGEAPAAEPATEGGYDAPAEEPMEAPAEEAPAEDTEDFGEELDEEPADEEPAEEQPADEPAEEAPAEEPEPEEPAEEEPVAEEPAEETPAEEPAEEPASEAPEEEEQQ